MYNLFLYLQGNLTPLCFDLMRLLTVTLVELADHVTGEAEVRAGDRVPGARAVTRDLD